MSEGYIKIDRKILDWEWWSDINTSRLFFLMLLKANWTDGKFRGIDVPRGSFVSSLDTLARESQLTLREVRTAISHLKTTGEVTSKTHAKFTVFTVTNYNRYQTSDTQNDTQMTDDRQADDKQTTGKRHSNDMLTTTIEEKKEIKNSKKEVPKGTKKNFEPPTVGEVEQYCRERNNLVDAKTFVDFYASKGWYVGKNKMKDWKAAVRTWESKSRMVNDSPPAKNQFNSFPQRQYTSQDYAEMERQLLQKTSKERSKRFDRSERRLYSVGI